MEKELTLAHIVNIANKVMDLIKSELGDNQGLIKTVLYECDAQAEVERRLKYINFL